MSATGPELSVVVVNWNAGGFLLDMLASLERNPPSVPWEAVVVDNASTDGSPEAAAAAHRWVRLLRLARNRGLAAGNNAGLAATTGRAVLIANPDVVLGPGDVDGLLAVLDRHRRAAFVVPRLAHPGGAPQTSAGDLPRLPEALLGRRASGWLRQGGPTSGFWWHGWAHDVERPIGRGAEACYLVRRAAVADIGPQDERYRLDWEGVDWAERARRAGWEIWLAPEVCVTHLGGVSISRAPLRWVLESHRGMYRYFAGRTPAAWHPALAVAVAARAALKAAAVAGGLPLYRWAQGGPG